MSSRKCLTSWLTHVYLLHLRVTILQHYVTEKVYDALLAGAIPVYFGAPNLVSDGYVSGDCVLSLQEMTPFHYNSSTGLLDFDLHTLELQYANLN